MSGDNNCDVVVVGGGAAGFFGAINVALNSPKLKVIILEKSNKLLSKVRISGGGRCNVTHHCFEATPLSRHYPRGQKELKKLFRLFQAKDVVAWFKHAGVELKIENDGRMFPVTNHSETIITCFLEMAKELNIQIKTGEPVSKIRKNDSHFEISGDSGNIFLAKQVLVAMGGHPHASAYEWIRETGHRIIEPIPSLFTFNDSKNTFKDLMGLSVPDATVRIAGTKFLQRGPVLITHWGLSGPAVIKLSAWAAEYLNEVKYEFTVLVNWSGVENEEAIRKNILDLKNNSPRKKVIQPLFGLPARLWNRLILLAEFDDQITWGDSSLKKINKLVELIVRCDFQIKGKTTFKEEFVTCGGVDWDEIDVESMQSKLVPGLFFAGEVINVDGETGGFNFQAAWTTAWVAAKAITSGSSA